MVGLIFSVCFFIFGTSASIIQTPCGLTVNIFINNDMAAFIRCEDTTGNSNPSWLVNNASDYQHRGLAELRLMGPSFTVLSLDWSSLPSGQARVQCSSTPAGRTVQMCTSTMIVTRHGIAQPRELTTENTTTTTPRTTTRRRGSLLFPGATSSPSTDCVAVGQFRRRQGMDHWCRINCNSVPANCPVGVCSCSNNRPR